MTTTPIGGPREPRQPKHLVTIPFGDLNDKLLMNMVFNVGSTVMHQGVLDGTVSCNSGHARIHVRATKNGIASNFEEVGSKFIGPGQDERFALNTAGMTQTCMRFCMDSDDAVTVNGLNMVADGNPADPRGFPGGIYYRTTFRIGDDIYDLEVVVAFSGIQNALAKMVAYTMATYYAGLMHLKLKAGHELTA